MRNERLSQKNTTRNTGSSLLSMLKLILSGLQYSKRQDGIGLKSTNKIWFIDVTAGECL